MRKLGRFTYVSCQQHLSTLDCRDIRNLDFIFLFFSFLPVLLLLLFYFPIICGLLAEDDGVYWLCLYVCSAIVRQILYQANSGPDNGAC